MGQLARLTIADEVARSSPGMNIVPGAGRWRVLVGYWRVFRDFTRALPKFDRAFLRKLLRLLSGRFLILADQVNAPRNTPVRPEQTGLVLFHRSVPTTRLTANGGETSLDRLRTTVIGKNKQCCGATLA